VKVLDIGPDITFRLGLMRVVSWSEIIDNSLDIPKDCIKAYLVGADAVLIDKRRLARARRKPKLPFRGFSGV